MVKEEKINKKMIIGEVISKYPVAVDIMLGFGLHCVGCHVNAYESIDSGALSHGMKEKKISEMIAEINNAIRDIETKQVSLSKSAAKKFKELAKTDNKEGYGLRLGIESGCCSSESYTVDFAEKQDESEEVFEDNGLKIFIKKSDLSKTKGTRINYLGGAYSGFKIFNPNLFSEHCSHY